MQSKPVSVFSLAVLVAALGYFVDIYDLLLFSIIRVPSLKDLGLTPDQIASDGLFIINIQMAGLLIGGILWGILGDKERPVESIVRIHHFIFTRKYCQRFCTNGKSVCRRSSFLTGVGLAGELGAGITPVSELLPKEKKRYRNPPW